jgi:hypothetical protein
MIMYRKGHKNSDGENAEWCIVSHRTGRVISSHKTKSEAEKHLGEIQMFKHMKNETMSLEDAKHILENNGYLLENASLIAYHISPFKFDKFKISSKSGMGTNFYGNGIYLTFDKNVIEHYLKLMKDEYENLYVYKVEISNTANIIDESDVGEYITDDIEEIDPSEISETLKENGIDGVKYWNEEDGNSIVIFNENKIKIVIRKKISITPKIKNAAAGCIEVL